MANLPPKTANGETRKVVNKSAVEDILKIVATANNAEMAAELDNKLWEREDVEIVHTGTQITLPALPREMSKQAAIDALQRRINADNEVVQVSERLEGFAFDAAVAFVKAMQRRYGWATPVATPSFWGPIPPTMLPVRTGPEPEDVIQVPLGSFSVPGVESRIETGIHPAGFFYVSGKIKNSDKAVLMQLITDAQKILKAESIYTGKALRITVDDDGDLEMSVQPHFMQTKHVKVDELILNDDVRDLLNVTLFTPIRKTAECVKNGIPLKRGIALTGPYGCGKSLAASVTSKVCVDNGWTFILLDKVQGLKAGLEFAQRYQPAVLFAEDIDRVAEERDDETNDMLNTIDGVLSKDSKVITVVTSNFPEKLDKAMLRPGRLDAVIHVPAPNAVACEQLVRLYGRGLIDRLTDLSKVGEALKGHIPATIREVVERSKLGMISRDGDHLNEKDLLIAVTGMRHHFDLLYGTKDEKELSVEARLGVAMTDVVKHAANGTHDKISKMLPITQEILNHVE